MMMTESGPWRTLPVRERICEYNADARTYPAFAAGRAPAFQVAWSGRMRLDTDQLSRCSDL